MGTNYYLYEAPPCPHCAREYKPLHIGKSSYGWTFALRIIPELSINSYEDWKKLWKKADAIIKNEEGEIISVAKMEECITQRGDGQWCPKGKQSTRHKSGCLCDKHGEGTWDYIEDNFS